MKKYLILFKNWYDLRPHRERILIILLSCALIYGLFSLILFRGEDAEIAAHSSELKLLYNQQTSWSLQIATLNQIARDPLYLKWLKEHGTFEALQNKYKNVLHAQVPTEWRNTVQSILNTQKSIVLVQLKDFPETSSSSTVTPDGNIIEQKHLIVVRSNFFDAINFTQRLEELMPNVRWDSLSYQVIEYPTGEVQLEFSVFYEKKS